MFLRCRNWQTPYIDHKILSHKHNEFYWFCFLSEEHLKYFFSSRSLLVKEIFVKDFRTSIYLICKHKYIYGEILSVLDRLFPKLFVWFDLLHFPQKFKLPVRVPLCWKNWILPVQFQKKKKSFCFLVVLNRIYTNQIQIVCTTMYTRSGRYFILNNFFCTPE